MNTQSNGKIANGTSRKTKTRFSDLFDLLKRKSYRAIADRGESLDNLLDELSRHEDGLTEHPADPLIRPEYSQTESDIPPFVDPSDGNNKKYHKPPYEYTDSSWQLGWTDGRCGQTREDNDDVIGARVRAEAEEEINSIRDRVAIKETTISGLNALLERREPRRAAKEQIYAELEGRRNANYMEFSRPLGYLYLGFALFLFLADIPLSLKLVAAGFQVPVEAALPGGVTQIGSSTKLLIDHVLFYPRYVLGMFWESMALAAGIAFLGIIVKYYMDSIVLRDRRTKRLSVLAIIVLTVILGGFVTTAVYLGNFRAEQQRQAERRDIEEKLRTENNDNILFNQNNPNARRIVFKEDEIDDEVSKRVSKKQSLGGSAWLTQTFILLTLLLPIVGGICFSASGSKLRNDKQYRLAARDYHQLEGECDKLTVRLKKEEGDLKGLQARLDQINKDPDRLKHREALKRGLYRHGYARGMTVPETLDQGASLYDRCEKVVTKLLAQKAHETLGSG